MTGNKVVVNMFSLWKEKKKHFVFCKFREICTVRWWSSVAANQN